MLNKLAYSLGKQAAETIPPEEPEEESFLSNYWPYHAAIPIGLLAAHYAGPKDSKVMSGVGAGLAAGGLIDIVRNSFSGRKRSLGRRLAPLLPLVGGGIMHNVGTSPSTLEEQRMERIRQDLANRSIGELFQRDTLDFIRNSLDNPR